MSGALLASSGPSAYWYLTRSTGAVALVLLSATVVLGVIDVRRADAEVEESSHNRFISDLPYDGLQFIEVRPAQDVAVGLVCQRAGSRGQSLLVPVESQQPDAGERPEEGRGMASAPDGGIDHQAGRDRPEGVHHRFELVGATY